MMPSIPVFSNDGAEMLLDTTTVNGIEKSSSLISQETPPMECQSK